MKKKPKRRAKRPGKRIVKRAKAEAAMRTRAKANQRVLETGHLEWVGVHVSTTVRKRIYEARRDGATIPAIAARFDLTEAQVSQVLAEPIT